MWELWGVEISPLPLKRHIAYTTACCYRTSREISLKINCLANQLCMETRVGQNDIVTVTLNGHFTLNSTHSYFKFHLIIFCSVGGGFCFVCGSLFVLIRY